MPYFIEMLQMVATRIMYCLVSPASPARSERTSEANMIMTVGPSVRMDSMEKTRNMTSATQSSASSAVIRTWNSLEMSTDCSIYPVSAVDPASTHELDTVRREPVEHLEEQERDKEHDERAVELVAEDGEREKRLRHREPAALLESLQPSAGRSGGDAPQPRAGGASQRRWSAAAWPAAASGRWPGSTGSAPSAQRARARRTMMHAFDFVRYTAAE